MSEPVRVVPTLRPMTPQDCPGTAELQIRYLGDGLFPRLGARFVRRWHETFVTGAHASAHVATVDGALVGFVLAATDQRGYVTSTLRTARLPLAVRGLEGLVLHPGVAVRFVRTRLTPYLRRLRRVEPAGEPGVPTAVVHAIVTVPAVRGHGIGRRLLATVEEDVATAGTAFIELLSEEGPKGGADFYRRLGWEERGTFVNRDDRRMVRFRRVVEP